MGENKSTADRLPSQEELDAMLRYDAETGKLYWKERANNAPFNARFSGREALTANCGHQYLQGRINGVLFYAHRVIWKLVHGHIGDMHIDHINGNRADNRLVNLRAGSRSQNQRNLPQMAHNTSGHTGVTFKRRDQKWVAQIKMFGINKHLGAFRNIEDAIAARQKAEAENGFHENHGRSAVTQGA